MIYGYARISTREQSIERQIRNIIKEYPEAVIIEEVFTGTSMNRKEWNKLMQKVEPGDTIVFDSVSRMSRTASEGIENYMELYNRGIELIFLKEHHIDTATYKTALERKIGLTGDKVDCILKGINEYLMLLAEEQIRIAFEQSQKEVADLRQRTKEGMRTAKLNGKQIGQPEGVKLTTKKSIRCKEQILKHSKSFGGTLNDAELQKMLGIARNTLYKYKRELKESQE